jgi:hypothetical protein
MVPVDQLQPLSGEEAQPQEERHVGLLRVFGRPGLEVEKRFLEDVGRIGPPLQAAIQAQPHDAAQPVAIVFPDPPDHLRIGIALADQLDWVFIVEKAHGRVTTPGSDWNTRKMALKEKLTVRGDLTGPKRAALDVLAAAHLETHGGDVEKSLAAVPANRSTRATLGALGEPEIDATLARITQPASEPMSPSVRAAHAAPGGE